MIAIHAGWFDALVKSQNGTITVNELARTSKADPSLVRRVMRSLVVEGIVGEPGANGVFLQQDHANIPVTDEGRN